MFRECHRNLILFLYDDEELRDLNYKHQVKDFHQERRKGLLIIKFEMLGSENPKNVLGDYFQNLNQEIANYKHTIAGIQVRRNQTGKLL